MPVRASLFPPHVNDLRPFRDCDWSNRNEGSIVINCIDFVAHEKGSPHGKLFHKNHYIKSSGDCRRCRLLPQSWQTPVMIRRWPVTRKLCSRPTASRNACSSSLENSMSLSQIWQYR